MDRNLSLTSKFQRVGRVIIDGVVDPFVWGKVEVCILLHLDDWGQSDAKFVKADAHPADGHGSYVSGFQQCLRICW